MRYVYLLLLFATLSVSTCSKEEVATTVQTPKPQLPADNEKGFPVDATLPLGSPIATTSLRYASILTEEANYRVEVPTGDGLELAYAINQSGKPVMLSYFNPASTERITMNATTTAVAIVLLHPWTINLAPAAREEAMAHIRKLPEFVGLLRAVEESIIGGSSDPLVDPSVLDLLEPVQSAMQKDLTAYKEPLSFEVSSSNLTVTNRESAAGYLVTLYDVYSGEELSSQFVGGVDKSFATLADYLVGDSSKISGETDAIIFPLPKDTTKYSVAATNGNTLLPNAKDIQATTYNLGQNTWHLLSVISPKLGKAFKRPKCAAATIGYLTGHSQSSADLWSTMQGVADGSTSPQDLYYSVTTWLHSNLNGFAEIVKDCTKGVWIWSDGLSSAGISIPMDLMKHFLAANAVYKAGFAVADLLIYPTHVDYCFYRLGSATRSCTPCDDDALVLPEILAVKGSSSECAYVNDQLSILLSIDWLIDVAVALEHEMPVLVFEALDPSSGQWINTSTWQMTANGRPMATIDESNYRGTDYTTPYFPVDYGLSCSPSPSFPYGPYNAQIRFSIVYNCGGYRSPFAYYDWKYYSEIELKNLSSSRRIPVLDQNY